MSPSKVIELMQIYLADHRREMTPDDVTAHAQAIGALLEVQLRSGKRVIRGISKVLVSARRVKNMLVRGGELIGVKQLVATVILMIIAKEVENESN